MTDFCAPPHVVASGTVPLEVAIQARAVLTNHDATDVAEALGIDDARRELVYEFVGTDGPRTACPLRRPHRGAPSTKPHRGIPRACRQIHSPATRK